MKLGIVMLPSGAHTAAWRDPRADAAGHARLAHFTETAQLAERGLLDFLFMADASGVRGSDDVRAISQQPHLATFEPLTALSAMAAVTRHIGLVATSSTSFQTPYQVARQFASLDLLSGGRAGVNLVTSTGDVEARNFSLERHYGHDERYQRAEEFAEVVMGLWDSWDRDAFVRDRESGTFFDPAKLHVLDHRGTYFQVRGPLNVPRSPQDRPLIVQAGSSEPGRELAGKIADVVFTAQTDLASAQAFRADVHARAVRRGRDPAGVLVMPGLQPVIGADGEDAQRKLDAVSERIHLGTAVRQLSVVMGGFDLSPYPIDGPLPYAEIPPTNGPQARQNLLLERARRENLTIRQLAKIVSQSYGHNLILGSPRHVADHMEHWVAQGAADGFILTATILPSSLEDIVTLLVPELQRRGLFRRAYTTSTLRGNLGLPSPASRYASPALAEPPHGE